MIFLAHNLRDASLYTVGPDALCLAVHVHSLLVPVTALALGDALDPLLHLEAIVQLEGLNTASTALLVDTHHTHRRVLHCELLVLHQTLFEGLEAMLNKLLSRAVGEGVDVSLQVCSGHLTACANGKGHHLLRHARGLKLEQMGAALVHSGNEKTNTVRPLSVNLGVDLGLLANHVDEGAERDGAAVGESMAEALLLHEVGENASIGGKAGNGDAGMFVDVKEFLLV